MIQTKIHADGNESLAGRPYHLEVYGIKVRFGNFTAVNGVSFSMKRGERLALLGPSGCGKTTLLNVISGFISDIEGSIVVNDVEITGTPTYKREVGIVFQNYALFPHLTLEENVYFGLKMRGISKANAETQISKSLNLVRLSHLRGRYPHEMSGGQQQRAAIARAIAINPEILLLDEPLSNLDAKLREEMRTDLLEILTDLSTTTILVTHDQAEALSLCDRVAVLNEGTIHQIGTPLDVYEHPATTFVANFLGENNALKGEVFRVDGEAIEVGIGDHVIRGRRPASSPMPAQADAVTCFIRAENLEISRERGTGDNVLPAEVRHVIYLGGEVKVVMDTPFGTMTGVSSSSAVREFAPSSPVFIACRASDVIVLPGE